MSPELAKKLAAAVDGMPAFPKSVQRVLELTRDVNSTPKDLVEVIDKDPDKKPRGGKPSKSGAAPDAGSKSTKKPHAGKKAKPAKNG